MKKRLLTLLFLSTSIFCKAQTFKELDTEDGLSSNKVYAIQKDKTGYMWFLTHEGIDRYNGKHFAHYTLSFDGNEISSLQDLNWLYIDNDGNPWEISKKGMIFKYDHTRDSFLLNYEIPRESRINDSTPISYSFIDSDDCIWMSGDSILYLYDIKTKKTSLIPHKLGGVTCIIQYKENYFFVGTTKGIYLIELRNNKSDIKLHFEPQSLVTEISQLYYDPASDKLIIGTFYKGLYIHDMKSNTTITLNTPHEISTTCIKPLNSNTLLIATDGAGIIQLNIDTNEASPYILTDYNLEKHINGNVVNAIYIDEAGRVWMAIYPLGIAVQDNRYLQYKLYNHSGKALPVIDDGVNDIIEDRDGDMWFATNNGVSFHNSKTNEWKSFLKSSDVSNKKNNMFYSLCEVSPGVIYASGYSSTIYQINKSKMTVETIQLKNNVSPNKHVRCMLKDGEYIWTGGNYLKKISLNGKEVEFIPEMEGINTIIHKDNEYLWAGSTKGLFLINKRTKEFSEIDTPLESPYIYSLCQTGNHLFIGTSGNGMLVYDLGDRSFLHLHKNNSALLSNNIYTILSDGENTVASTETGLVRFFFEQNDFRNWTKEQGLYINDFNVNSGTLRKNNTFIFGGCNGAIEFSGNIKLPKEHSASIFFTDFMLFNQKVFPNHDNSPLTESINDTRKLVLKPNENIFSFKVSSISYNSPSDILYSWKLEGFYNEWSTPTNDNIIQFTNLNPGTYTLYVRAITNENKRIIEERSIEIVVQPHFFRTVWAIILYIILAILITGVVLRLLYMWKEKNVLNERFRFFTNTAHDIRTPLTLIKAPLNEIKTKEQLTKDGILNMSTAMRNVNILLQMSENLVNVQKTETFSKALNLSEYELNSFMREIMKPFHAYADSKKINFTFQSNFRFLTVWLDKDKIDSILQNIITNALKYTPDHGSVSIYAFEKDSYWSVEIKDTGMGIPLNEQRKLFKENFRAANVKNSRISGSGVGMMIAGRLLKSHKGKVSFTSAEQKGTTITVTFPLDKKQYKKAEILSKAQQSTVIAAVKEELIPAKEAENKLPERKASNGPRILIAEDNAELRQYLSITLSEEYTVQSCKNGKEALVIIDGYKPELIVSDVLMPEMGGDELCTAVKSNIETSHIPVILITALNDEENILKGIQTGADDHITKPFNIDILKASIANLLNNRALLRNKYASLDLKEDGDVLGNCVNYSTNIDWGFIANMKKHVEANMASPTFNVESLCTFMSMSRTSLYNKIKALTDTTPRDYIRVIKLKRAAELLKEGKYNVTEVAEMTGFNDAKYFREVFKKHFCVSPSKYRDGGEQGLNEKEEDKEELNKKEN